MLLNMKKFGKALLLSSIIGLSVPTLASAQTPESVSVEALDLAATQQFGKALTLLDSQSPEIRETYDIRFTRARILAWSNDFDASANDYQALLIDYPGNPDIQSGYGYLEYYRNDFKQADFHFQNVLAAYPDYEDARKGLELTRKAREEARRNRGHTVRIDANAELSTFNNGRDDWNNQSVRVEYVPGKIAINGKVARYDRFGLTDIQLMGGARSAHNGKWDWEVGGGFTPSADFRADVTGLARIGRKFEMENGTTLRSSLGYQIDDYDNTGTIGTLTPQIEAYFENGLILTGRLIHIIQDDVKNQTGFLVSADTPIVDRLSGRAGYANAPETVNGIVIDTESIFGGLRYQISESTDVHATYTRDDRENTYVRNGVNVGLTQRY